MKEKKKKFDWDWIWQGLLCILILLGMAIVQFYFIGPVESACTCNRSMVNAFMPIKYMNEMNWNGTLICEDLCGESDLYWSKK